LCIIGVLPNFEQSADVVLCGRTAGEHSHKKTLSCSVQGDYGKGSNVRSPHPVSKGTVLSRQRNPMEIFCAAWSPDGGHIATGDAAGRITIWQAESGQERRVYEAGTSAIISLTWSPDGTQLASGNGEGYVVVWRALSGKAVFTFTRTTRTQEEGGNPIEVAWSPDGRFIASSGYTPYGTTIQVLDALTGEEKVTWPCGLRYIAALQWSPGSEYLAIGDSAATVHLWNPFTGQRVAMYQTASVTEVSPLVYVNHIAWSPDGRHIAFGDTLGIVQLWDVIEHRSIAIASAGLRSLRRIVLWKPDPISGVAWLPDGTSFIVACRQSVQVRRATTARRLATYLDPFEDDKRYLLLQVDWSPDRQRMVSVGGYFVSNEPDPVVYEGCMYVWEVED
jgi:WD40 repeat protein